MRKIILTMAAAGLLASSATIAFGESRIHERRENQQRRIGNGIANGALSPREAANLEHKQAKLNHEIRTDRKENGGNLTNKEKIQINRQQNRQSRDIYREKHDGPGK
jgi:hypothetical protein